MAELLSKSDYVINTSQLLTRELKAQLEDILLKGFDYKNLFVTVLSFGFKYGIPTDADLVFDVRFLPNPYYFENMRLLTGNDAPGLTAVLCSAGALSCFPAISGTVSAAELVSNDFEVNYGGWYGSADAVALTAEDGIGRNTSRGMSVTGRTSTSDGASAEKGFYLSGGETYTYSVWVYSETAERFHLSLSCADLDTAQETETELTAKRPLTI